MRIVKSKYKNKFNKKSKTMFTFQKAGKQEDSLSEPIQDIQVDDEIIKPSDYKLIDVDLIT